MMANSNEHMREYMKRRYRERRELAVRELGGKCAKCGSGQNLEFDHIDRTQKSLSFGRMTMVSMDRFRDELTKGQLLCDPCHGLKTIVELGKKRAKGNHGTLSTYTYCRCELCRKAKREYQKRYYESHPRNSIGRVSGPYPES